MALRTFCTTLALSVPALWTTCSANAEPTLGTGVDNQVIAQAQARIQSLRASIDSVELYSGKRQSPEKIDFYRLQIAREERVIECARSPGSLNCEQVADAAHPELAPCPDEQLAR